MQQVKCTNCNTLYEGNFCPKCGTATSSNLKDAVPLQTKWYEKTWLVILALIIFWPVGLFLMWKYKPRWNLAVKIIITVILAYSFYFSFFSDDTSEEPPMSETKTETMQKVEEKDPYIKCTVSEMKDLLDKNAAKAAKTYEDQYVEITGVLCNIDSDLSYISLSTGDDFELSTVHCDVTSQKQEKQILEMEIDDEITIRGKCTSVGEVLGYYVDIESIE